MANLSEADLGLADLTGADLREAKLSGADLLDANPEDARLLDGADLRGVTGLTKEQLAACKAKGAVIDEDLTTIPSPSTVIHPPPAQSNDRQLPSAPPAQESVSTSDTDVNSVPSSPSDPQP